MNLYQSREIDKIYKEVTGNRIKSRVTLEEKIIFIKLITGKLIKIKKTPPMIITPPLFRQFRQKDKKLQNWLPNWLRGGRK